MAKQLTYFVSDVHLGLQVGDPQRREKEFLQFLGGIDPAQTASLYLLGDIFDFWYEYRYVVPKGGARVLGALTWLVDCGVKVYFFEGNHDHWCFSYFEELGMVKLQQPHVTDIAGKRFCLGHGDGLGRGNYWYKFVKWVFTRSLSQTLFSALHPWLAFRIGIAWSSRNRLTHGGFVFDPEKIPLRHFVDGFAREHEVDAFVFGHYHHRLDTRLEGGQQFVIVGDWIDGDAPYALFDGESLSLSSSAA